MGAAAMCVPPNIDSSSAAGVQMMDAAASQLSAAIFALMCSLTARNHHGPGLMGLFYHLSFARWGLEGMQHPRMRSQTAGTGCGAMIIWHPQQWRPHQRC